MNSLEAKAEIFSMAFKSMSKEEKDIVLKKLLEDREFREDIIDIALIEQRRNEPSYSFDDYLGNKNEL
jgi:hypothetical protein